MNFENNENNNFIVREGAKKSVVGVHFPERDMTCTYYNDKFNLKLGDIVYVDGKLEGIRGQVVEINYNFKIKLSDYKRVIGVADTFVVGEFHQAGSHFITTDKNALNYEKAITWFKAPESEEEEYASSSDDKSFSLSELNKMEIKPRTAERGYDVYADNRVLYMELNGGRGRAIVKGSKTYEVEFNYRGEKISNLVCSCYCIGACKHQFATMLQLKDIINIIKEEYPCVDYNNYVSAISKATLFEYAINDKNNGAFVLK